MVESQWAPRGHLGTAQGRGHGCGRVGVDTAMVRDLGRMRGTEKMELVMVCERVVGMREPEMDLCHRLGIGMMVPGTRLENAADTALAGQVTLLADIDTG